MVKSVDESFSLSYSHRTSFFREDGSFTISKIPPGSYIVEVVSSNYVYEPLRVDINTKGKFRARRINYILNTQINPLPYPLKMKALGNARYFQVREQWRLIDLLFNPMVNFTFLRYFRSWFFVFQCNWHWVIDRFSWWFYRWLVSCYCPTWWTIQNRKKYVKYVSH